MALGEEKNCGTKIRERYPDRVPVILHRAAKTSIPEVNKSKMLISDDTTVGELGRVIARRAGLDQTQAIFIFIGNSTVLPRNAATILSVYEEHKDEDGYLHVTYSGENVFG